MIDFAGFGAIRLTGSEALACTTGRLAPGLRRKLRSFIFQLDAKPVYGPLPKPGDDNALVGTFMRTIPDAGLLPHFRALAREIARSGFRVISDGMGAMR